MDDKDIERFNAFFPSFFNEWFDKQYPVALWSNLLSQWKLMKVACYDAYLLGAEDYKEG